MNAEIAPETVSADRSKIAGTDVSSKLRLGPSSLWPEGIGWQSVLSNRGLRWSGRKVPERRSTDCILSRADMAVPTRLARALRCDYLPWNRDLKAFELQAVRGGDHRRIKLARRYG